MSPDFYTCSSCCQPLFERCSKYESGTGFPSFWSSIGESVERKVLTTYGRVRVQVLCSNCGLHLGHLFPNKKTPTGERFCINHDSILFPGQSKSLEGRQSPV